MCRAEGSIKGNTSSVGTMHIVTMDFNPLDEVAKKYPTFVGY